jgi:hypothetical protein
VPPCRLSGTSAVGGTDCSAVPLSEGFGVPCASATALHTAVGWDDVTGVGTPNAQAFVHYFIPGADTR